MRPRKATLGLAPILPGLVLVLVIVWALAAVLMLTGTLVNAREIDQTIPLIQNQVSPIDKNLDNVALAKKTENISGRILTRAKPLVGRTDEIITEAQSIDRNAESILDTARSINGTAKTINGNVKEINETVSSINRNVVTIGSSVGAIQSNVLSIGRTVGSIDRDVTSINARVRSVFAGVGPVNANDDTTIKASVDRILGTFTDLTPETRSIDSGVAAINRRGDSGIDEVRGIRNDLVPVFVFVGLGNPAGHDTQGPGTIHGHANSIDCSSLINSLGPTEFCNQ
jgi:methyl-accepting chemotaxis protein